MAWSIRPTSRPHVRASETFCHEGDQDEHESTQQENSNDHQNNITFVPDAAVNDRPRDWLVGTGSRRPAIETTSAVRGGRRLHRAAYSVQREFPYRGPYQSGLDRVSDRRFQFRDYVGE